MVACAVQQFVRRPGRNEWIGSSERSPCVTTNATQSWKRMNAAARIKDRQRQWAKQAGHKPDAKGYVRKVETNLWRPLHSETRKEFERASGNELRGQGNRPAKMRALHSSAALACNVFDFWRDRDKGALAKALVLDRAITSLSFEMQLPTGLVGTPPNLDLFLTLQSGASIAIESKFTEAYGSRRAAAPFKVKYFPKGRGLWADAGLPNAQKLAVALKRDSRMFEALDAPQLLKHALGVARQYPGGGRLLYLFYDDPGPEGARHREEVSEFTSALAGELRFRALSYQEVFEGLKSMDTPEGLSYVMYLRERYFRA